MQGAPPPALLAAHRVCHLSAHMHACSRIAQDASTPGAVTRPGSRNRRWQHSRSNTRAAVPTDVQDHCTTFACMSGHHCRRLPLVQLLGPDSPALESSEVQAVVHSSCRGVTLTPPRKQLSRLELESIRNGIAENCAAARAGADMVQGLGVDKSI